MSGGGCGDVDELDADLVARAVRDAHTVDGVASRLRVTRDRARSLLEEHADDVDDASDVLEARPFERASEERGGA